MSHSPIPTRALRPVPHVPRPGCWLWTVDQAQHHPDMDVILLNESNVKEWIPDMPVKQAPSPPTPCVFFPIEILGRGSR